LEKGKTPAFKVGSRVGIGGFSKVRTALRKTLKSESFAF